jgi:hypothetical protein
MSFRDDSGVDKNERAAVECMSSDIAALLATKNKTARDAKVFTIMNEASSGLFVLPRIYQTTNANISSLADETL